MRFFPEIDGSIIAMEREGYGAQLEFEIIFYVFKETAEAN